MTRRAGGEQGKTIAKRAVLQEQEVITKLPPAADDMTEFTVKHRHRSLLMDHQNSPSLKVAT